VRIHIANTIIIGATKHNNPQNKPNRINNIPTKNIAIHTDIIPDAILKNSVIIYF